MRAFLENKAIGRTVEFEVSETFMKNPDDIRLVVGAECYKLVSTKSETDKKRETLGIEFANEYFSEFQKGGQLTDEELAKLILEKLNTDKYKELLKISDKDMLMKTIITSYRRYDAIANKMMSLEKEIRDTTIDQNVFFDYIERLKKLIESATMLKDFHEGLFKVKEMSQCDERVAVGIPVIFECVCPLIEEEQSLLNEIRESNKGKNIKDMPIFTDKDFWIQRFAAKAKESLSKLFELYTYWRKYREQAEKNPLDDQKFTFMLDNLISVTKPLVELSTKMKDLLGKDDDAVAIEKVRKQLSEAVENYCTRMRALEIMECLDPRKYNTIEEATFIDTNFAEYRSIENGAAECAYTGEKYSWHDYLLKLSLNYLVCVAIKAGKVDLKKLLDGSYTDEELRSLVQPTNPEVK